ncbi:MAG: universal stress protein [Acidobacteria bacterium]|nr:universal stress protein [Acidobacteriota bacterium]
MKILIGYDGSESSDAAIDDLKRAGLPRDSEAKVIAVGDLLMSSPSPAEMVNAALASPRAAASLQQAQSHATRVVTQNGEFAKAAANDLRLQFPEWKVSFEVATGTPAWVLIEAAKRWKADLAVVGSQDRSTLGRLFLGSVSKSVATDATCSVRVARRTLNRKPGGPRIMIGVDGSPAAEQAIYSVGQRVWGDGTEIKLVAVDEGPVAPARVSTFLPQAAEMVREYVQQKESRVQSMLDWATEELGNIGLQTSMFLGKGEPSRILIEEAHKWNADSIFVGTRDFDSAFERFRLGSVSTAVVSKAHCSVEIVRPPETQA